jgi:hypothetical protein
MSHLFLRPFFLPLALLCVFSGVLNSAAALATQAEANSVAVGDWFAVGSGCKSTHKKLGNVEFAGFKTSEKGSLIGTFLLKDYRLSSPPTEEKTSLAFARECNVRVQVTPPKNKRVRTVSARTEWEVSKDAPVKVQLQNTLYIDSMRIGASYVEVPAGEKVGHRNYEIRLAENVFQGIAAEAPVERAPLGCGQMTVVGSDYTVIAHRKQKSDAALVRLKGETKDRVLEIALELEDCKG